MFHTFELGSSAPQAKLPRRGRPKKADVPDDRNACEECRRRKIRCDRKQPCEACVYYKKPRLCRYVEKTPSQRKLSVVGLQYRAVLKRLFPSAELESLFTLSREQLVNLVLLDQVNDAQAVSSSLSPSPGPSPEGPLPHEEIGVVDRHEREEGDCLDVLESVPDESEQAPDAGRDLMGAVSDDVNSLSPAIHSSSYLGVSSIHAVMKVMIFIDPASSSYLNPEPSTETEYNQQQQLSQSTNPDHQGYISDPEAVGVLPIEDDAELSLEVGLRLIDAFFTRIHAFVNIIDEAHFRSMYLSGTRQDGRWMALLNMVFTLGCMALNPADDATHGVYFQRLKDLISLEYFANPHIESVQTLGLMAGYYLHFINQPHLAYSLMGVAIRMAAALGLHKEPLGASNAYADLQRRVWWSLFCLDTFSCMTLGRPTFGRYGSAINIKPPERSEKDTSLTTVALVENTRFCLAATQIQEALATSPRIPQSQMADLDRKLVDWYQQLPSLLTNPHEAHSTSLATIQSNFRWRYLNARMLLYRPVLLNYAMRRTHYAVLPPEERQAILKCRSIARETISTIAEGSIDDPIAAWGSTWYIFQAVLVPLLLLFIRDETLPFDPEHEPNVTASCQAEVNLTIAFLSRLDGWAPTAQRTLEVVSRIFHASQRVRNAPSSSLAQAGMTTAIPGTADFGPGSSNLGRIPDWNATPPQQPGSLWPRFSAGIPTDPVPAAAPTIFANSVADGMYPSPESRAGHFNPIADQKIWDYISWTGNYPFDAQLPSQPANPW